jgi:nicotinamide-nucleotide amidase
LRRMITSIPGSSGWFKGSVVAYSNDIKTRRLGVDEVIIRETELSAASVLSPWQRGQGDLPVLIFQSQQQVLPDLRRHSWQTGWNCLDCSSDKNGTIAEKFVYGTDRLLNIRRFSLSALNMLRKQIIRH